MGLCTGYVRVLYGVCRGYVRDIQIGVKFRG